MKNGDLSPTSEFVKYRYPSCLPGNGPPSTQRSLNSFIEFSCTFSCLFFVKIGLEVYCEKKYICHAFLAIIDEELVVAGRAKMPRGNAMLFLKQNS